MRIDISFLPALAATFMLVFARIGIMVMLLPGLGEMSAPSRVRLSVALVLAAMLLPLHRNAYQIDLRTFGPVATMLAQEVLLGTLLGFTVRLLWKTRRSPAHSMPPWRSTRRSRPSTTRRSRK